MLFLVRVIYCSGGTGLGNTRVSCYKAHLSFSAQSLAASLSMWPLFYTSPQILPCDAIHPMVKQLRGPCRVLMWCFQDSLATRIVSQTYPFSSYITQHQIFCYSYTKWTRTTSISLTCFSKAFTKSRPTLPTLITSIFQTWTILSVLGSHIMDHISFKWKHSSLSYLSPVLLSFNF